MKTPILRTGSSNRIHVARDLDRITTVTPDAECDPVEVGLSERGIDAIWNGVRDYYRFGLHPAITLVLRRHGKIALSRGLGHAQGNGPGEHGTAKVLASADSPACLFSCSKAFTAMLIHKLAEDGLLDLHDPVARYIPEFARNGKEQTTIFHLLAHRAGIARIPLEHPDPSLLLDFDFMVKLLCASPLDSHPGERQAYHAATSGYILGELAQRVSGKRLPELLRATLAEPLGCNTMTYGLAEDQRGHYAKSWSTGPDYLPLVSELIRRILSVDPQEVAPALETPEGHSAVVPAANLYASAEEMCRFYQMLLDKGQWQGRQVFKPETVQAAIEPAGKLVLDGMIPAPVRFSPGFVLGEWAVSLFGLNTPHAFGHLGFQNILGWADPDRDIACAFITTGKAMSPEAFLGFFNIARLISKHCPRH